MEKLPPTSYVRMVDVWLIFGQLIPFVEVSLLTIMELYNVDMDRVNHHGTAINTKSNVSIQLCFAYNLKNFHQDISTVQQAFTRIGFELNGNEEKKGDKSNMMILTQVFKNIIGDTDIAKWAKTTEKKIVPTLVLAFFCVYWTFGIFCYNDIIKTYQTQKHLQLL